MEQKRRGRKATPDVWGERVARVYASDETLGAVRIEKALRAGPDGNAQDFPSLRVIGRLLQEAKKLTAAERAQWRDFAWPETMDAGLIPWEASDALLGLLRYLRDLQGEGERWTVDRPIVRNAAIFWRVTLAAPDLTLAGRWKVACILAAAELAGDKGADDRRCMEAFLSFAPWRSAGTLIAYGRFADSSSPERTPIPLMDDWRPPVFEDEHATPDSLVKALNAVIGQRLTPEQEERVGRVYRNLKGEQQR